MLKTKLSTLIKKIAKENFGEEIEVSLQKPPKKDFGNFSTNAAMQLASHLRRNPQEIGKAIIKGLRRELDKDEFLVQRIRGVEFAPPGFINFFLKESSLFPVLAEIDKKGLLYGSSDLGRGKKINIEFVSANPTGPLNIAHGRQAALGDTLANILGDQGYSVSREYYINDEGNQIKLLGESTRARYLEILGEKVSIPREGYRGDYIKEIARIIFEQYKEKVREKDVDFFAQFAMRQILEQIKKDLQDFGVEFDVWFSQRSISSEKIKEVIRELEKRGYILREEGATFFKSTIFGDDKDRVLIKSNGEWTYFAPDIAYHQNKYQRGFSKVINLWGPDHHGYVLRLKAAVEALGYPLETISILIVQLVTLYRGREKMMMSTRAGEFISLRQLLKEIGRDAARFFFVSRRSDSHLDFDLELAKKKSLDNPVYYIQYAHARICSIIEFAKGTLENSAHFQDIADLGPLLNKKKEIELIKKLEEFPEVLETIAQRLEPHRLTTYLYQLSSTFHSFYNEYRVVTEDKKLSSARLLLVRCTKIVLQKGLELLGITAPKRM
ncbi:MAG: arginine--tRNA ligase [Candidatus Omnitrophica bacterium]|nr:arginine--tRNA ligase [Candidatus Omnitrophota bacterium]